MPLAYFFIAQWLSLNETFSLIVESARQRRRRQKQQKQVAPLIAGLDARRTSKCVYRLLVDRLFDGYRTAKAAKERRCAWARE